jgi:hypothetical protein
MKKPTKFGPRYGMKRFVEGGKVPGMTSYAESGSAGGKDMSFGEAFKAARAVAKREGRDPDKDTFTWRGKKYTTELAEDKSSKRTEPEDEETGTRGGPTGRRGPRTPTVTVTAKRDKPKLPSDRATGYRSQVEETGMSPEERMNAVRDFAIGTAATVLPAARIARGAATELGRVVGQVGARGTTLAEREAAQKAADKAAEAAGQRLARRGVPSASTRASARQSAQEARAAARRDKKLDERLASDMEGGFKRGGSVKRYASGGSVSSASKRADGCATKGKTRGRMI